ncbi:unnamed protein product, partial [Ilex paraguariensis]
TKSNRRFSFGKPSKNRKIFRRKNGRFGENEFEEMDLEKWVAENWNGNFVCGVLGDGGIGGRNSEVWRRRNGLIPSERFGNNDIPISLLLDIHR